MKKTMLLTATVLILTVACKKNNSEDPVPPPPTPTVSPAEGFWTGKYTTTGQLGFDNYAMLIKAGGFARIYDLGTGTDTASISPLAKVNGVWILSGNTVQTTYQSGTKTVNTSATLNAAKTQMNGTWSFDAAVKGNIELGKQ